MIYNTRQTKGNAWLAILFLIMIGCIFSCNSNNSDEGASTETELPQEEEPIDTTGFKTVHLTEIDDILYNPGMGFANFMGDTMFLYKRGDYPNTKVTYIRWYWDELEPAEGEIAFDMIDNEIEKAKQRGETFAFRVMAAQCAGNPKIPQWLIDKGIQKGNCDGYGFEPDFSDVIFMEHLQRLIKSLGQRYNGHPRLDHVDIGGFGCWGEWNLAGESYNDCGREKPSLELLHQYVDWHIEAFPNTPLTIPENEAAIRAIQDGSGWRADCLGDWGVFSSTWNHMEDLYPAFLEEDGAAEAWKQGPVQFEICSSIDEWYNTFNYNTDKVMETINWSIEQHASVINLKYLEHMPDEYWPLMDEWQRRLGYRFVVREVKHSESAIAGSAISVVSTWENVGIAPVYRKYILAYRLRNNSGVVGVTHQSTVDLTSWLPGQHEAGDTIAIPEGMVSGDYYLDIAILDLEGQEPAIQLAIEGKRNDGWYEISQLQID